MTDKEILGKVYERLKDRYRSPEQKMFWATNFIEQEWQKEDELLEMEQKDLYADSTFSKHWYNDVKEIERHRGLEIGEDGTVKELK